MGYTHCVTRRASLFIDQGFSPKRVEVLMGHETIQMTFDGHLFPSAADDQGRDAAVAGAPHRMNARRFWAVAALCFVSAMPMVKAASPQSLADLLIACYGEEGGSDRNFCLGYLLGVWDALPEEDACVQPGMWVSAGMLREVFLSNVGPLFPNEPAKDISASRAARTVIYHYFPCRK
jgi:hypothetical protein